MQHSIRVAQTSYAMALALKVKFVEEDLIAGGLLHDFYLYDWHDRNKSANKHATKHPLYARENAVNILGVSEKIASIIETHMWPLPPQRLPKSIEAWIITVADKICSMGETLATRSKRTKAC